MGTPTRFRISQDHKTPEHTPLFIYTWLTPLLAAGLFVHEKNAGAHFSLSREFRYCQLVELKFQLYQILLWYSSSERRFPEGHIP